jgi:hypothetical protein
MDATKLVADLSPWALVCVFALWTWRRECRMARRLDQITDQLTLLQRDTLVRVSDALELHAAAHRSLADRLVNLPCKALLVLVCVLFLSGCSFWNSGPSDEQLRSAEGAVAALRTEREAIGRTLDALPAGELKEKLLVRYGELQALLPRIEQQLQSLRSHSDRSWADVTAAGLTETGRQVGGPWGALIGLAGGVLALFAGVKKRQADATARQNQTAVSEIVTAIEAAKTGDTVDLAKVVMGPTGKRAVDAEQERLG